MCRAFIRFCRGQKLTGGEVVAIDGSKVETVVSRKAVVTPQGLKKALDEDDRRTMHRRTVDDPTPMKRRRDLAEHPFGTMKGMMGAPRFLVRGLEKAEAEFALTVLGFNMERIVTIRGVESLLAGLQPRTA